MFSRRIRKVISVYREHIGMLLVGIGAFALIGLVATDDYRTSIGIYVPMLPLIIKSVLALAVAWAGEKILNGGGSDESAL